MSQPKPWNNKRRLWSYTSTISVKGTWMLCSSITWMGLRQRGCFSNFLKSQMLQQEKHLERWQRYLLQQPRSISVILDLMGNICLQKRSRRMVNHILGIAVFFNNRIFETDYIREKRFNALAFEFFRFSSSNNESGDKTLHEQMTSESCSTTLRFS